MTKLDADQRNAIDSRQFAFPKQRKEPLENASHVRNAIARFDQVEGVSDAERDVAWKHITAAAKKFGVEVREKSWRELGAKQQVSAAGAPRALSPARRCAAPPSRSRLAGRSARRARRRGRARRYRPDGGGASRRRR